MADAVGALLSMAPLLARVCELTHPSPLLPLPSHLWCRSLFPICTSKVIGGVGGGGGGHAGCGSEGSKGRGLQ